MAENKKKKGLGRGLSSLLGDQETMSPSAPRADRSAPIDLIRPNPDQPRRRFPPAEMEELTSSIREKGILQPLLVRQDPSQPGAYQIIAGERRWRAAQAANLHEAPIVVRDFDDAEVLEIAIIENVQRADLDPIEEAAGYAQLVEKYGHTQAHLAAAVGKSRSHIANSLRLLSLPEDVQEHLALGRLSSGHARALITSDNPSRLAQTVIAEGLSVRQTEALAKKAPSPAPKHYEHTGKDADTRVLEGDLSAAIGLKVSINHKPAGGGVVTIAYSDLDELDGVCQLLSR